MKSFFGIGSSILGAVKGHTESFTKTVETEGDKLAKSVAELRSEVIEAFKTSGIKEGFQDIDKAMEHRNEVLSSLRRKVKAAATGKTVEQVIADEKQAEELKKAADEQGSKTP